MQTFGVNNIETAEWLSKTLGQTTIEYATMQHGTSKTGVFSGSKTPGTSQQFTGRSLLIPDEVMHLPDDEQILMVKGMPPVAARKLRYFADKEFKGLFEPSG